MKRLTSPFFPWRLFIQFVIKQSLIMISVFVIFGAAASYYFHKKANDFMLVADMLPIFNQTLLLLLISMVVVFLLVSLWMGQSLLAPLGTLIRRATRLIEEDYRRSSSGVTFESAEEPGELSDLATALETLRKNLKGKTEQISIEQSEAEAIMSSVSEAIFAVDQFGQSMFFNSQFAVLFGQEAVKNRKFSLSDIFRAPEILNAYANVLKEGRSLTVPVTLYVSGAPRHFSLSVAPLMNKARAHLYGAIGIFHDVTELKRVEQIRIEFVGNVSHELRTPLTAIKGYADTLREDIKAGRLDMVDQYTGVMTKNVDRLMSLVGDLLDLSSLEAGLDLQLTEMDPREVTEHALEQLESKRSEKQHEIVTFYEVSSFEADPKRVEQVIINLVENAIKYIPVGKRIEIRWEHDKDGAVLLKIKDNGPGISKIHQDRLFERFYRVDDARSRENGGTGLGLAIVKHIMQRHGGYVQVKSDMGVGTEFTASFPSHRA